jgi:hypothetical protein
MKIAHGLLAVIAVLLLSACVDGDKSSDDEPATAWGGTSSTPAHQGAAAASWGNAPDFSYTTFNGRPGKLSDSLGRPVVVNFWAAW